MSRWKKMRPLPIAFGGLITVVLALLLLPKPSTETPVEAEPVAPGVEPAPIAAEPAPFAQPSSYVPPPAPADPVLPVPSVPADPNRAYPVNSRGFQAAMRARTDDIIACYHEWNSAEPRDDDRIVVRFYIEPGDASSYVDRVEVMDSPLNNAPMEQCVLSHLEDIEFQPTDTLTVYTFPFNFGQSPPK